MELLLDILALVPRREPDEGFNWDTVVKVSILLALYPVWWPVLKALYQDFQGALWEEGGLFGREPTPREHAELEERYGGYRSPLRSETYEEYRERLARRPGFRDEEDEDGQDAAPRGTGRTSARGPARGPRRGF